MTSFLLCGLVFVEWASLLRTGDHMLHSEANTRHWQMFRFLFPGFPELCFHICSCWYFSWNTNWQNHENKLRRAVNYIFLCHGLHIWSWHDESIKMLDGKTKWRESEPDEKGGSLFINQTESGRSFPLAGSMEGVALHSLWPSPRPKRAKLSTATVAAIHSLDHGGASDAALAESEACEAKLVYHINDPQRLSSRPWWSEWSREWSVRSWNHISWKQQANLTFTL